MAIAYRDANIHDATSIMEVTNDAFQADCFFKKPEYYQRFTIDDVRSMIQTDSSVFILAVPESSPSDIMGSIHLHWEIQLDPDEIQVIGKFSAVSVPEKFGKKGIGKGLVKTAERKVLAIADRARAGLAHCPKTSCRLQMGVINLRNDLFPWYESQGFRRMHEIRPNDPEVERITLPELRGQVCCVLMEKELVI